MRKKSSAVPGYTISMPIVGFSHLSTAIRAKSKQEAHIFKAHPVGANFWITEKVSNLYFESNFLRISESWI